MTGCYILYSPLYDKYYIGATQEDPVTRLLKHKNKAYGSRYTSFADDWEIYLFIECENYRIAVTIERHIKSMKSKKYLLNLKTYPEIIQKLKEKFSTGI